ncbi:MAG: hypothetical protein ABSG06_08985 [Methanoregula sp.]|jgi:hypothetical protein
MKNKGLVLFSLGHIQYINEETMAKQLFKPVVVGTTSGNIIRWICPTCYAENAIINRTAGDFFKASRDSTCRQCRNRSTITTPRFHT